MLVDALVLLAIGSIVLVVMTRQPAASAAQLVLAEPFTASVGTRMVIRDSNRGTALSQRLYRGEDIISAVIAQRDGQELIFPGDRVHLFDWQSQQPLFRDLPVLAIDPTERGQVRMTFAVRSEDLQRFKDARQQVIFTASRSVLGTTVGPQGFDASMSEVIERRFQPEQWMHRVSSR